MQTYWKIQILYYIIYTVLHSMESIALQNQWNDFEFEMSFCGMMTKCDEKESGRVRSANSFLKIGRSNVQKYSLPAYDFPISNLDKMISIFPFKANQHFVFFFLFKSCLWSELTMILNNKWRSYQIGLTFVWKKKREEPG